jgi:peptide/nickel transport system permease protein
MTEKGRSTPHRPGLVRWLGRRLGFSGAVGIALLLLVMLVGGFAPLITPEDPTTQHPEARLAPPSSRFLAGTDELGRDVLSRIIMGARVSVTASLLSVLIGLLVGVSTGVVAAYFGGYLDEILMRLMDLMLAFPPLLLALFITAMLGPSLRNLMLAIGVVFIPSFARVARGSVLTVVEEEYVKAAIAIGVPEARVILRHILPNASPPIVVQSSMNAGWAILTESAMSFIGLGAQPPTPSWGAMLSTSREYLLVAPWTAFFPGIAVIVTVVGFSLVGDWLRDVSDPRVGANRTG